MPTSTTPPHEENSGVRFSVNSLIGPHGHSETRVTPGNGKTEIDLSPWIDSDGIGESVGGHPVEKEFTGPVILFDRLEWDDRAGVNTARGAYVGEIQDRPDEQTLTVSFPVDIPEGDYTITFYPKPARSDGKITFVKRSRRKAFKDVLAVAGCENTVHFDTETIWSVFEDQRVNPFTAPEVPTVFDIRSLLSQIQTGFEEVNAEWMDNIEDGETLVIAETPSFLVLDVGADRLFQYDLELYEGDAPVTEFTVGFINELFHKIAKRVTDRNWGHTYPHIVGKTDAALGPRYTEALMNHYISEGLTAGQAWAFYGVEVRGNSQTWWAKRQDRDQSTISEAYREAKRKLPDR